MKFAKTLKKLRKKAKMTRYALARESRVDPTYLARLESGARVRPGRQLVLGIGPGPFHSPVSWVKPSMAKASPRWALWRRRAAATLECPARRTKLMTRFRRLANT